MFNARGKHYEKLMGRWSRRLAPLFMSMPASRTAEILEIGCGTGSLTFALPQGAALARLTAIDHSPIYLAAAQARNNDPCIRLEQGDGSALRFPDASFDRALSMLVLPSVLPEPSLMVAEMRRVTRPGGVVAAAFWDRREAAKAAYVVGHRRSTRRGGCTGARSHNGAAGLRARCAGADAGRGRLTEIDQRSLMIRMDFAISPITDAVRQRRGRSAPMSPVSTMPTRPPRAPSAVRLFRRPSRWSVRSWQSPCLAIRPWLVATGRRGYKETSWRSVATANSFRLSTDAQRASAWCAVVQVVAARNIRPARLRVCDRARMIASRPSLRP